MSTVSQTTHADATFFLVGATRSGTTLHRFEGWRRRLELRRRAIIISRLK